MIKILIALYILTLIAGLFYYYKYEVVLEDNKVLKTKIKDMKTIKNRTQLMMIKDKICEYKKGGNAYTTLRDISNIINKVELESSSTINSTK